MYADYLTNNMTDISCHIKEATSIINQIKKYPIIFLREIIKKSENDEFGKCLGIRTFFWLINAVNVSNLDPTNCENKDFAILIVKYFNESYKFRNQEKKDSFWLVSSFQALKEVNLLANKFSLEESLIEINNEYKGGFHILASIFEKDSNSIEENYLKFWIYEVLKYADGHIDIDHNKLFNENKNTLEKHIALYCCNTFTANQIELGISARFCYDLLESYGKKLNQNEVLEVKDEIKKASEICFNSERSFFEKRYIQSLKEYIVFNSMPYEDIYFFTIIGSEYLYDDVSIIKEITNFIKKRMILFKDSVYGIFEESSSDVPNASSYFTGYSIVLLSNLIDLLKAKLKDHLFLNIKEINIELTLQRKSTYCLDNPNMYESQENAVQYIKSKFDESCSKHNSILIFGPPGTGKTTIVEGITNYLKLKTKKNWSLITLPPSLFLTSDSYSQILKNIELLFEIILQLNNCIFFFDEAEELIRKRSEDDLRFGRMFTASMVLFLNRIKDSESVYIFATNYIDKMDEAAIRKGRFSIRKGIGWIKEDSLRRFINKEFESCSEDVKDVLFEKLKFKTIKELFDIKRKLLIDSVSTSYSVNDINTFFEQSWKNYISSTQVKKHIEQCIEYDDSYLP